MPALRIHTHCQVAQNAYTQTKTCQKSKSMVAQTHRWTANNKARKHNIVYSAFGG